MSDNNDTYRLSIKEALTITTKVKYFVGESIPFMIKVMSGYLKVWKISFIIFFSLFKVLDWIG